MRTWCLGLGLLLSVVANAQQPGQAQLLQWAEMAKEMRSKGDSQGAAALYERVLAEVPRVWGEGSINHAAVLNQLALAYKGMGQFAKAEPLYRRSLEIREATVGRQHPDTATALNNLAVLYRAMGQYTKAEPLYRRCLEIREATLGRNHADTSASLGNLAALYYAMGDYAKSEPLYRRNLEINTLTLGKDHFDTALSLNNMGLLYLAMARPTDAEPMFLRALEIRAKLGNDNHPNNATVLNNLAILYQSTSQYAKAEPLYRKSLEIRETKLGKDHPETIHVLHNLAWNQASQEKWAAALTLVQRARQTTATYLADLLPVLTEKEQLAYLESNFEWSFFKALSLGRSAPKEMAAAGAEWLLNGKAVAHQALAEQFLLARDARSPQAKQLVDALQQTRSQLATQVNRLPKVGFEAQYQQETQKLKAREQELARTLARAVGRAHRADPWVTLPELQAKLGPKSAFLDIARFRRHDFSANKSLGYHYVAWITPPKGQGDVQIIDLGEAETIDQLVAEARKSLLDSAKAVSTLGEAEALAALQRPLGALSAKVLHPLLPALEKYEEWIVCPDGALWLTPWNALSLPGNAFAIEKHLIRHVVSGRDLVLEEAKTQSDASYLFADPDYDLSLGKVATSANDVRAAGSVSKTLPRVARLPGTALEAEAIKPHVHRWLGKEPALYLEEKAGETIVKSVKQPRVLVLATHGYFLPVQRSKAKETDRLGQELGGGSSAGSELDDQGQPIENPLLRCGLLLAGCNKRAEAKAGEDDGILTGLEIVGMDLRGTELVVLSACETGLGDVRSGEGVAGLRQAFQLAGAKGVLASLWQVPDRETALLMNAFYGELTKGKSQASALREAQLSRIAARKASFGAAHPFFWAAFTLTSRGAE